MALRVVRTCGVPKGGLRLADGRSVWVGGWGRQAVLWSSRWYHVRVGGLDQLGRSRRAPSARSTSHAPLIGDRDRLDCTRSWVVSPPPHGPRPGHPHPHLARSWSAGAVDRAAAPHGARTEDPNG